MIGGDHAGGLVNRGYLPCPLAFIGAAAEGSIAILPMSPFMAAAGAAWLVSAATGGSAFLPHAAVKAARPRAIVNRDRKRVWWGKRESVRVGLGGGGSFNKKIKNNTVQTLTKYRT